MILGTFLGIIMTSRSKIVRLLTRFYLEFIRIMPQLVLLFIVYFGLARNFNINISGESSAIIVFTDGYIGDLEQVNTNKPVVWLVYDNPSFEPPCGKKVEIEIDK